MASNDVIVEVVNCDLCEVNKLNWMRSADSAKRLVFLRKRQFPPAGYFVGTVADALAAGWEERDYGVVCPSCVTKEREQEERDEAEGVEHGPRGESTIDFEAELKKLDDTEKEATDTLAKYIEENPAQAEVVKKQFEDWKRQHAEVRAQVVAMKAQQEAVAGANGQKENVVE